MYFIYHLSLSIAIFWNIQQVQPRFCNENCAKFHFKSYKLLLSYVFFCLLSDKDFDFKFTYIEFLGVCFAVFFKESAIESIPTDYTVKAIFPYKCVCGVCVINFICFNIIDIPVLIGKHFNADKDFHYLLMLGIRKFDIFNMFTSHLQIDI